MRLFKTAVAAFVLSVVVVSGLARAAEEPRKFDFTVVLLQADKKPFNDCMRADDVDRMKCVERVDITLGWLAAAALDVPKQGLPGPEKIKRGKLAHKIYEAKAVELTAAEVTSIIDALGELSYRNTAIAAAVKLLDPASVK